MILLMGWGFLLLCEVGEGSKLRRARKRERELPSVFLSFDYSDIESYDGHFTPQYIIA